MSNVNNVITKPAIAVFNKMGTPIGFYYINANPTPENVYTALHVSGIIKSDFESFVEVIDWLVDGVCGQV